MRQSSYLTRRHLHWTQKTGKYSALYGRAQKELDANCSGAQARAIQMADQIIMLTEDGQIAESGTHQELLAKGGAYKTFWDKKAKSASWEAGVKPAAHK